VLWNDLGVSHSFRKEYEPAGKAFAEAHRLAPQEVEYLVNLATLRQWQGRTAESLSLYRTAAARSPKEPVYQLKSADIYLAQGKKAKAREALQRAWELRPASPKLLQQMGEDFRILGEAQRAAECFEAAKRAASEVRVPVAAQP
jgi:tetratricopeptide (TPR) repeat protein